jgi:outer membrane lipoprotein-sorting protein
MENRLAGTGDGAAGSETMKGKLSVTIALVALSAVAVAVAADWVETLRKVDSSVAYMDADFSAEYTLVQTVPGSGSTTTVAAVLRRDRERKMLVVVLKPDAGKAYLRIGDNLWIYDPKDGSMIEKKASDAVYIANLTLSDMTVSTLASDYEVVSSAKERYAGFDCEVLDLKAAKPGLPYARKRLWISPDGLMRKMEDWSATRLMRTVEIPSYQKIGTRSVPLKITVYDNLKSKAIDGKVVYERTEVSIAKASFAALKDAYFTQDYLKSRKK